MSEAQMHLKLLLPHHILLDRKHVTHIQVETYAGAYGFLPHRLDCVAPLPPGILAFTTQESGEVFVALDEGVLVKTGADVLVSVRNAMIDADLEKLRDVVEKEFLAMDEQALQVRIVMAKLESSFLQRFAKINER